jgi:sigma-B regulation protein RsbU (phosphoserine phosphatase)
MVLCQDAHLGPENWLTVCPCSPAELDAVTHSDDRLLVALPLMLKAETFGVLLVEEALGGRRFRNRRLEILNGMAQQIALAIQNDVFQKEMVNRERLELEVQLARQIQETFIPKQLTAPQGWDLAARWRTAHQMGGDFYDVIHLPDGRLGLFIADVADKGIPAALFMALTRTLVRAAVLQTDSPAEALAQVNDLLYPDCEQGMFVTAVYGALDPKTGRFTYANAGHNPPLLVHAHLSVADEPGRRPPEKKSGPPELPGRVYRDPVEMARVETLTRTGIALGVVERAEMTERSIDLAPGDYLVFYTDGITEAFSPEWEVFGDQRLLNALPTSQPATALEIIDVIDNAVIGFILDAPVADDITLIAVKRLE